MTGRGGDAGTIRTDVIRPKGSSHFTVTFIFLIMAMLFPLLIFAASAKGPVWSNDPSGDAAKRDLNRLAICRRGIRATVEFAASRPDLFPREKIDVARLLPRGAKEAIWSTWRSHLDYLLALDSLGVQYGKLYSAVSQGDGEAAFLVAFSAFLAQYSSALEFIALAENDPGLDTLLNDAVPEIGLPAGSYGRYKYRFLNIARAAEFAAMSAVYEHIGNDGLPETRAAIEEDSALIWKAGRGKGEILTMKNALAIIRKTGFTAWFPVQAGVSEWMGDTKVKRAGSTLITADQIRKISSLLEPGDIVLERREWYLSNIGLPGFWPHAAIYIGTPDERQKYFNGKEVREWVAGKGHADGDLEALLGAQYPDAYLRSISRVEEGRLPRVIEAVSEGVSFTSLEHSLSADSIAVLRPRLPSVEKAAAIWRAFRYSGRPYDYNFDFITDSAFVCTELVFKSFQPEGNFGGLSFTPVEILGRTVLPANEIARLFDSEYGTPDQQLDLVVFLDGREKAREAILSSLDDFRKSWLRPKWHVLVQDEAISGP